MPKAKKKIPLGKKMIDTMGKKSGHSTMAATKPKKRKKGY